MKPAQAIRLTGLIALGAAELAALIFLWIYLTPRSGNGYPPLVHQPITMSWLEFSTFIFILLAASLFFSKNKIRYFATASLCAALILAVLWVRSTSSVAEIAVSQTEIHAGNAAGRIFKLNSRNGKLTFSYDYFTPGLSSFAKPGLVFTALRPFASPYLNTDLRTEGQWYNFTSIRTYSAERGTGTSSDPYSYYSAVSVSYWLLLLLCLPVPALYARQLYRKHRRQKRGLCIQCGYDLRAAAGKCPECGMDVPVAVLKSS